jgi:hypothetical protein
MVILRIVAVKQFNKMGRCIEAFDKPFLRKKALAERKKLKESLGQQFESARGYYATRSL